jgi:hypothetical protein
MRGLLEFCKRYGEEKDFEPDFLETKDGGVFTGMRARFDKARG